jgi:hypothetical protein
MSTPKPAVGRIVHVIVDPKRNNGSDVAPAMITRVWSDTCVNLRVIPDYYPGPEEWLTSYSLHESREALEAHRDARQAELPEGQKVALLGAFWPPHV